ncbi:MAG: hypothetical protein ISN26_08180, partial [Betaproteobacteria bacterium AqS2]|nr:hypothetical protein [Betaproteobacteria bacterium AqS2]
CSNGRQPENLTLAWLVTVQGPTAWRPRANDKEDATGRFSRYDLLDSTAPTETGIQIHRSADDCPNAVDVTLSTDTPDYVGLDLHGDGSGVALARSHSGVAMPGSGATDRHLRLFFAAGADVPEGVLGVTATLSSACAKGPQEAVYQLTVYTPADHAWVTLSQDSQLLRATSFRQSSIRDGELETGIRLHRNSADCKRSDVELLSGTEHLELVAHSAAGAADGTGAAELEEVLMDPTAGATDRHVRLRFKAGALPPGAITATLRIAAAASCTSRRNPDAETFTYVVPIVVDIDTPPQLRISPATAVTINADAETTGIRINASDDDDSDVVVELASAARSRFTLARQGAGAYELRVNAAGTLRHGARYTIAFTATDDTGTQTQSQGLITVEIADGAPVLSLSSTAVTIEPNRGASAPTGLTINASDDDAANVRIVLDAAAQTNFEVRNIGAAYEVYARGGVSLPKGARFTLTITAIDDVGPGADLSATARALVMIRSGSAVASDDAVIDAGAAAARAIGVGGIDAVLSRSAADARLSPDAGTALLEMLAAKEHELESGEIDLREFLEGQSVALGLNQNPAGRGANVGLWLTGSRRDVGGVAGADRVYVDGELQSMNVGLDGRFGAVLAGVSYGLHSTTAEYGFDEERENEDASEYELELQAVQPYAAFDVGAGRLAVAIAAGSGELVLRPAGEEEQDAQDVAYLGYALGVAQRAAVFGNGQVRLRGSYAVGEFDVDQLEDLAARNLDSAGSVLRLALGYGHVFNLGEAASFSPFVETGYLNMWGDGAVGDSLLVAGGLEFNGGPVAGSASYQQALSEDVSYEGYDLSFRLGARFGGLGLGLEADPGYGLTGADGLLTELDAGRPLALADEDGRGLRGGAGLSYGLALDGGLLTPYGRWSVDAGRELGLRLRAGARRSWALGYGAADNDFRLTASMMRESKIRIMTRNGGGLAGFLFFALLLLVAAFAPPAARAQAWLNSNYHDADPVNNLNAVGLNAASEPTYTGLAFDRYVDACSAVTIQLEQASQTIFGLIPYDGDSTIGFGINNAFDHPNPSDQHSRIFFRETYTSHSEATLTISINVNAKNCNEITPTQLNVRWPVTVADPWQDAGAHSDEASTVFSPVIIGESTTKTETGYVFHKSPATCRNIDVALGANSPDSVELVRYDEDDSIPSTTSLTNIRMIKDGADNHHVKLMLKAGATLAAGSTLTVSVTGSRNSSCGGTATRTQEWKVTVATPASWVDGNDHDGTAADDLTDAALNAATSDTWTGLAYHRTAAGCDSRKVDLYTNDQQIFGLHKYDGSTRESNALA